MKTITILSNPLQFTEAMNSLLNEVLPYTAGEKAAHQIKCNVTQDKGCQLHSLPAPTSEIKQHQEHSTAYQLSNGESEAMNLQMKQPNLFRGPVSKCSLKELHQISVHKEFSCLNYINFLVFFRSSFLYHIQQASSRTRCIISRTGLTILYKIKLIVIPLLT